MTAVLCIGGLDPAGRAGLLADARAVEAQGVRAICVASALTFQSSRRVDGFVPVDPDVLARQLATVLRDEPVRAVKIGQLGAPENVAVVLEALQLLSANPPALVVDTPLISSSGAALFPLENARADYAPLFAAATLVTPNAPEAALLSGADGIAGRRELEAAALSLGAPAVLLKGGHVDGPVVTDVLLLADGARQSWSSNRLPGSFRGTGCRLASAIAGRLASGETLEAAVGEGRAWLQGWLERQASGLLP